MMSTAIGQANGRAGKSTPRESEPDLYDPHFPARQRTKNSSDRTCTKTFDPYFQRKPKCEFEYFS